MKKKPPNLSEKCASALLLLTRIDEKGNTVPLVDREWAKGKTARQIIGLFEFDHDPVPRAFGGSNHPTNLKPRIKVLHRDKTNVFDVPIIARAERVSKKHEEFRRKMLAKAGQVEPEPEKPKPRSKWGKRKMQSRSSFGRRSHV